LERILPPDAKERRVRQDLNFEFLLQESPKKAIRKEEKRCLDERGELRNEI
jgi:hypothetical protein